jgi:hypothetical protein
MHMVLSRWATGSTLLPQCVTLKMASRGISDIDGQDGKIEQLALCFGELLSVRPCSETRPSGRRGRSAAT